VTILAAKSPGTLNLQATLAASSAGPTITGGHHPICCSSRLWLHEDGRFECEHGDVPGGDERTRHCIDHSVALLLIECAMEVLA